ncbi:ADP-ribosylglycohydrolase family protein [Streptomyces sp. NPDC006365]|uniref:ADP-ribosylglycohydrolase family protein n=1 Tax=Streptomyces sp. NPDC006365 TaxID=3364744 RepID=UPI0036BADC7D
MTPVGVDVADRVLGGWLGRIAGNMLGKPVEQGDHWTRDRIDHYLRQAAALPLTDYLPEPVEPGVELELRPEWRECVRGRIHGSCRDDDVDYAILGLDLLETYGFGFSTEQVGELWLLRLPYLQTFTAERVAYRNLADGLKPPLTATHDNPYQEWIGALIRADIYGWTSPGDPRRAASLARRDAVLSHTANGVQKPRSYTHVSMPRHPRSRRFTRSFPTPEAPGQHAAPSTAERTACAVLLHGPAARPGDDGGAFGVGFAFAAVALGDAVDGPAGDVVDRLIAVDEDRNG